MARGSSTGIILILFMCVIFVIGGGLYVYTTRDQAGDKCTGDDPNAEYTLDQDLNCTFVQCYPGFGINEDGACVFIAEEKAKTELELAREDLKLKQLAAQSAEITSEGEKAKAAAELLAAEDRQRAAALALEAAEDERRAAALALEAAEDERKAAEIEREAELAAEAAPGAPGARTYSIRGYNTNTDEDGGGNAVYLDRQHVNCGDDALNRFQLTRPSKNTINYRVHCLEGVNSGSTDWKKTKANEDGGGNAVYLDRHRINCGMKPISKFWLRRPTDNQINYDYKCSNLSHTNECRVLSTPFDDDGGGNAVYLDRQNVKCGKGEAMTEFVLRRNPEGNKIRYEYKCCKMP